MTLNYRTFKQRNMEELYKALGLLLLLAAGSVAHGFRLEKWRKRSGLLRAATPEFEDKLYFTHEPQEGGEVIVEAGKQLILDCWAGGRPEPTIHWYHGDERILPSGNELVSDEEATYEHTPKNSRMKTLLRLGNTKSRLVVDCATQADAGTYTCVAESAFKRIVSTVDVITKTDLAVALGPEPACDVPRLPGLQVPARIYMWSADRLEFEGADVQLFCRSTGVPTPMIKWYDVENRLIGSSENDAHHYQVLPNGDLLIREISFFRNMGNYRCVVENDSGSDEVEIFLYPTMP